VGGVFDQVDRLSALIAAEDVIPLLARVLGASAAATCALADVLARVAALVEDSLRSRPPG